MGLFCLLFQTSKFDTLGAEFVGAFALMFALEVLEVLEGKRAYNT